MCIKMKISEINLLGFSRKLDVSEEELCAESTNRINRNDLENLACQRRIEQILKHYNYTKYFTKKEILSKPSI